MPPNIFMRKAWFPSWKQKSNPKSENTSAKILQGHDTSKDRKFSFFSKNRYLREFCDRICAFGTFRHRNSHIFEILRPDFAHFRTFGKFRNEIHAQMLCDQNSLIFGIFATQNLHFSYFWEIRKRNWYFPGSKSRNFADLRKFGEIRNRDSRRKSAYFHKFEKIGTEIGIFRVKNSIFGEILLNFPQISTFSIKYSGATMQDFDLNSCACESWDLEPSQALAFASMHCMLCFLEPHEWSRSPFNFSLENAVISGEMSEFSKMLMISNEYSEATVRDFDINPGACESWDLEVSHAQGFASIYWTVGHVRPLPSSGTLPLAGVNIVGTDSSRSP